MYLRFLKINYLLFRAGKDNFHGLGGYIGNTVITDSFDKFSTCCFQFNHDGS